MNEDTGPSRETLLAQIEALNALVERQHQYIGSMRASRFWKIRDAFSGVAERIGLATEPLPVPSPKDLAATSAAFGDPYQLLRARQRRTESELDSLRGLVRLLAARDPIALSIDARGRSREELAQTLDSLREQVYPYWNARVALDPRGGELRAWIAAEAAGDGRIAEHAAESVEVDERYALAPLDAGDVLEPDALLSIAIELYDGADVVYTDEDRFDAAGVPRDPHFKPDWSPETALTRDYVGRMCVLRVAALGAAGGLDPALGSAMWYDALLRVSERSDRIAHVPRVLVHRRCGSPPMRPADARIAVRAALARRGELSRIDLSPAGLDVRFLPAAGERVCVIVPTRDRADLLERCLGSVFERTTHADFEVVVLDNGSTEEATRTLLAQWKEREPDRFRVIADPGPFNFSRLNNVAAAQTDAPYLLLLNNDTEVIAPEWMSAMLGQARRPPIGAVGALLFYDDDTIQHAGVMLGGVLGLAGHAYRYLTLDSANAHGALNLDTNYLAVTGACLMVAKRKFVQVGGLDELLAVAYNDIDLCTKLYAAGYRNVVVAAARLYHHESKSRGYDDTREKVARALRESDMFRARWQAWAQRDPYYNPNLTLSAEDFSVRQ